MLYQLHRHLDPRIPVHLHRPARPQPRRNGNLLWGMATVISRGLQRDHQLTVEVPARFDSSATLAAAFETRFLDEVWAALGDDHLVLMMDEAVRLDEEVQAGRLDREVFDYLRHLMQHFERLNFVFSLGSGVEEMSKDYAFLFSVSLYHRISSSSPFGPRT